MAVVVMQAKQKTTRKTSDIPGARLSFLSVPGGLPNGYFIRRKKAGINIVGMVVSIVGIISISDNYKR
jgi:hypothetical protein